MRRGGSRSARLLRRCGYLSSYQLGDHPEALSGMVGGERRGWLVMNALDGLDEHSRRALALAGARPPDDWAVRVATLVWRAVGGVEPSARG